jgi:hypothetical protein
VAASPDRRTLPWPIRGALAACGAAALALAALAGRLTPDARGYGTHQQLGLPPCGVLARWDVPCPSCGMTTAWAHAARGEWLRAWAVHPGGALAWTLAAPAAAWALASAAVGSWLGARPRWAAAGWPVAAIVGLSLVDWLLRLIVR